MIHRITIFLTGVLLVSFSAFVAAQTLQDEIRERLMPAGSVCVVGDDCAAGLVVAGANDGPRDPESVYQSFCFACHQTGVSEAPILGNAEQWAPHLEKGIDTLYESAINGLNVMPPRGTCVSCSDDELRATVDFMVEQVQ